MKRNIKNLSFVLAIVAGSGFALTSCGSSMTDAEIDAKIAEMHDEVEDVLGDDITDAADPTAPTELYESEEGKFRVNFIGGTPKVTSEMVPTEVGEIEMTTFMYEKSATEIYAIFIGDYPSSILDLSTPQEMLNNGKDGVINSMGITSFDLEEEVEKDGNPGLHFRGTNGTYFVEYEMYLVDNRLYQIGILRDGYYPTAERVEEFFGTFELVK